MIMIRTRVKRKDGRINFAYLAKFPNNYNFGFRDKLKRSNWERFLREFRFKAGNRIPTHLNGEKLIRDVVQFGRIKGADVSFIRYYSDDLQKPIGAYKNSKRIRRRKDESY